MPFQRPLVEGEYEQHLYTLYLSAYYLHPLLGGNDELIITPNSLYLYYYELNTKSSIRTVSNLRQSAVSSSSFKKS